MELTYHRKGEYLFPNLAVQEEPVQLGKYAMLRRTFLKENRQNWYQSMLLTGKLNQHLLEIEKAAEERMDGELAEAAALLGIAESLRCGVTSVSSLDGPVEAVAKATRENAMELFGIPRR